MKITCKDWLILVPLQDKIDSIHESVIRGNMREVRGHLDKRGWANARDHYGHSPLHKSVMANQEDIMKFILRLYPDHIEDRDNVSTVCPRSKILERNWNNSETVYFFWPLICKCKMCLRTEQFDYIFSCLLA